MSARLIWMRAEGEPVEFPLEGEAFEVGRDGDAAIRIEEPLVSRLHARLERQGGSWLVRDLDSTNFTLVNGRRIRNAQELEDGDELRFARARCVFRR